MIKPGRRINRTERRDSVKPRLTCDSSEASREPVVLNHELRELVGGVSAGNRRILRHALKVR